MWSTMIVAIMTALTVFYANWNKEGIEVTSQAKSAQLAESMALYRGAVVAYFNLPENAAMVNGSVTIDELKAKNVLPTWSDLNSDPSIWANYMDASGQIYVYAYILPPVNITADVVELAQNSIYAGIFRDGSATLFSPVVGATNIQRPPASVNIPDGSPVWMAMRGT